MDIMCDDKIEKVDVVGYPIKSLDRKSLKYGKNQEDEIKRSELSQCHRKMLF